MLQAVQRAAELPSSQLMPAPPNTPFCKALRALKPQLVTVLNKCCLVGEERFVSGAELAIIQQPVVKPIPRYVVIVHAIISLNNASKFRNPSARSQAQP